MCEHSTLVLNVSGPKYSFYYCANCGQGFECQQFTVTCDDDDNIVGITRDDEPYDEPYMGHDGSSPPPGGVPPAYRNPNHNN